MAPYSNGIQAQHALHKSQICNGILIIEILLDLNEPADISGSGMHRIPDAGLIFPFLNRYTVIGEIARSDSIPNEYSIPDPSIAAGCSVDPKSNLPFRFFGNSVYFLEMIIYAFQHHRLEAVILQKCIVFHHQ